MGNQLDGKRNIRVKLDGDFIEFERVDLLKITKHGIEIMLKLPSGKVIYDNGLRVEIIEESDQESPHDAVINNSAAFNAWDAKGSKMRTPTKSELIDVLEALVNHHWCHYGLDGAWDTELVKAQDLIKRHKEFKKL